MQSTFNALPADELKGRLYFHFPCVTPLRSNLRSLRILGSCCVQAVPWWSLAMAGIFLKQQFPSSRVWQQQMGSERSGSAKMAFCLHQLCLPSYVTGMVERHMEVSSLLQATILAAQMRTLASSMCLASLLLICTVPECTHVQLFQHGVVPQCTKMLDLICTADQATL